MGVKWTEDQRQVIDARGCDLLVSAAAGSGKTAVLVERILSMLTDKEHPRDIDRLLIVTFTNAAAGEMKDRIRVAIEQKIEDCRADGGEEERLLEHLQRQVSLLSNAQITTIHSFCQYVIRNHFHTIDLDPGLHVADEGEQKLLQSDVMDKLVEEAYAENTEEFRYMAECLAPGRDDAALAETALSLYHFSRSFPFPEEWLQECRDAYDLSAEEFDETAWVRQLQQLSTQILEEVRAQIEEALAIAESPDGPYPYCDALEADLQLADALLAEKTYTGRCAAMQQISWTRLSAKKDASVSEEKKQQVKNLRESYKKAVEDLRTEFYSSPAETAAAAMRDCAPVVAGITEFVSRFAARYAAEKVKKNMMDFDDLEHFALQILVTRRDGKLCPTPVAEEFAAHYEEILIDEYQDSNLVQELILTSISKKHSGGHNLFMVGDVKQSIYRFRLARPELFTEKYDSYRTGEPQAAQRRIDLHRNFRSRSQVLTFVNFLFEQIMEKHLGNVEYDDAAALYPGAEFAPGDDDAFRDTEVLLIDAEAEEEKEKPEESARELEAYAVAQRIAGIVGKELVWDNALGAYRRAEYRDIVILLRTIQGWAEPFAKVLTEQDIPAHTGSRTGYFSTTEVQTVLSLLRVIDNPRQDIPLTAVLHSPIVWLSAGELAAIRSAHPQMPFYEACMQEPSLADFFAMLAEFRRMAAYTPIHELLWYIFERTGYAAYAAAMPGGSQRKANLDMLVEKAIAYEQGSYRGLYNFVRYIENLHKYDVDFGEAASGEQENAVRILSIHKSKGLEFPIVFVCGMGKQMNQSDARKSVVLHADLGIGCDRTDPKLRIRSATLLKRFMKRYTVQENLGEELRVLYVALTRAKEKLILTGTVTKLADKLQKWGQVCRREGTVLPFTLRAHASTYWDWLIPSLLRNRCFAPLAEEYGVYQDHSHPLFSREIFCRVTYLPVRELTGAEKQRQKKLYMTREKLLSLSPEAVFDAKAAQQLAENLSFCYAYGGEEKIPAKVSVSELKKYAQFDELEDGELLFEEPAPVPLIPEFLQEKSEVSGAARGTIYHKLMECLDFTLFADTSVQKDTAEMRRFLEAETGRLQRAGHLKAEEAELISEKKLLAFLKHPLAQRMAQAAVRGQLFREQQFVLSVPAGDIRREWQAGGPVLIQGIIDAYFIEDGQIVLVDYKTDFVKFEEASSLYRKYAVQLDYYEIALTRLAHLPVSEKLIYSFCLDCTLDGRSDGAGR
ncbi:ATP-dependent nuclease subunit A [Marvinbryantia formatexigens DSM 14469]|uniref:ATP-dependent helicase/nuclease subunit A n=1 Tax=Marvinbryantia formatexigens DSM 14469 TaxID=478749 RepID=C6LH77_9FIRM|nr:helicase-exonuclease AddAB subunit AddA [Marvinbryantia formatexigens]EET60136.1 ATP-dependent nuclease subunit A [Marvinbryantia formatexigens DSM 14469]UWO23918.1 helicase-exonuclease AddAB subunit AddA [Marvinbryantia formatexigens DSM 14469]SDG52924.1 DNA helicase/exodeoxyribonuclease V, subunit A [Marvinbryantia formatexigens]